MTNSKTSQPSPELKKLEKKLRNRVGKAIAHKGKILL